MSVNIMLSYVKNKVKLNKIKRLSKKNGLTSTKMFDSMCERITALTMTEQRHPLLYYFV